MIYHALMNGMTSQVPHTVLGQGSLKVHSKLAIYIMLFIDKSYYNALHIDEGRHSYLCWLSCLLSSMLQELFIGLFLLSLAATQSTDVETQDQSCELLIAYPCTLNEITC